MRLTNFFSLALVSVFVIASAFTSVKKENGDWFFLEDKKVGFGVDHDVIHFGNWKDDVRQIKLKVTDGPLKMYSMINIHDARPTANPNMLIKEKALPFLKFRTAIFKKFLNMGDVYIL